MDHVRILGTVEELAAWNGGSCGGISLERDQCDLHLKRFPALASVYLTSEKKIYRLCKAIQFRHVTN